MSLTTITEELSSASNLSRNFPDITDYIPLSAEQFGNYRRSQHVILHNSTATHCINSTILGVCILAFSKTVIDLEI